MELDSDFAQIVEEVFRHAATLGIGIRITSSFRSSAEQAALFRRYGRPRAAPPGRSFHEYGFAVDFATIPPGYESTVGQIAEAYGLRWGGRFRGLKEPWHIDAGSQLSLDQARRYFGRGDYLVRVA